MYSYNMSYTAYSQHTQNTLACTVAGDRTPVSNLATLSKLHWLPVHDCIEFKIATLTMTH